MYQNIFKWLKYIQNLIDCVIISLELTWLRNLFRKLRT